MRRYVDKLIRVSFALLDSKAYGETQVLIDVFALQVDHHYIVNLRYAFQDDANCFFALDLMLGGDLRCASFASFFDSKYLTMSCRS